MQRREVIDLFREICECIPHSALNGASIMHRDIELSKNSFELRLNISLSEKDFRKIDSIVKKRNMILERNQQNLLIYSSEIAPGTAPVEIFA
jgi:hypothetical protein